MGRVPSEVFQHSSTNRPLASRFQALAVTNEEDVSLGIRGNRATRCLDLELDRTK